MSAGESRPGRGGFAFLALLYTLSGAAALVLEVAWVRMAGTALGTDAIAATVVLAAFMGGLGFGALAAGRLARRLRRPVRGYGLLEGLVALAALAMPHLLFALERLPWSLALALASLAIAFAAACMGATYPLVSAAGGGRLRSIVLYALNTLGAAAGALLAAYALLPRWGVSATSRRVALALGALALLATAWGGPRRAAAAQPAPGGGRRAVGWSPVLGAAAFAAGFAALVHEVAFFRLLSLVLGGTIYGFAIMLATYLVGMAAGSLAAGGWLARRGAQEARRVAAVSLGLAAASALAAGWAGGELPWLYVVLFRALGPSPWLEASLAAAVLAPAAFFSGAGFAALLRAVPGRSAGDGESAAAAAEAQVAGRIYGWNTIGAVLGSSLAGGWILPALGIGGAIGFGALVAGLGASVLGRSAREREVRVVLAVAGALAWPRLDPRVIATGAYGYVQTLPADLDRARFRSQFERSRIEALFHRDGRCATVTVERFVPTHTIYLKTDGKVEGSVPDGTGPSRADMSTQVLLAAAPLAFAPRAEAVAVVGLGSGVSAATAAAFEPARLEVIEIERAVWEAVRAVPPLGAEIVPLARAHRLRVRIADARRLLARSAPGSFDVVIAQPSEPWRGGSAALFTREAFRAVARALRPGGIAAQWVQLYGLDRAGLATLLATFESVFAHVAVLRPHGARELILLGSDRPLRLDPARVAQRIERAAVRRWLERAEVDGVAGLLGELVAGTEALRRFAAGAPVSTDDHNRIAWRAPRTRFVPPQTADRLAQALLEEAAGLVELFGPVDDETRHEIALAAARAGNRWAAEAQLAAVRDPARRLRWLGDVRLVGRDVIGALRAWDEALRRDPGDEAVLQRLVRLRLALGAREGGAR